MHELTCVLWIQGKFPIGGNLIQFCTVVSSLRILSSSLHSWKTKSYFDNENAQNKTFVKPIGLLLSHSAEADWDIDDSELQIANELSALIAGDLSFPGNRAVKRERIEPAVDQISPMVHH